MATLKQIQFKRSKTAGARPAASVLAEGELAINLKDRTIFTKDDSGNIIDLGIAKGGQIDGNVTIDGTLRVNGPINNFGNFSTSGTITASNIVSATVFRSTSGSFYTRAINDTANAHLWFENTNGSERGVLYSKPQSENEGVITMRVRQGTAAGAQNSEFHFISTDGGIFQARKLTALTSISTPTISVNLINHVSKAFGQYDSQSLVQYVYPGTGETNGVNYLRKVRAKSGGTIYHEICTAQTGLADEMSWWTGNTPLFKLYGIRNDGRMIIRNSLAIGTVTEGYPSSDYGNTGVMGDRYLALGDTASGLKWVRTGVIDLMANGISAATIINNGINSTKKLMVGYSRDSGTTWDFPNNNQAMFTARTDIDGNNNGDGQTHIGYNSNSKMYHYFRGTGRMAVGMSQGLLVEPGILDINTGSNRVAIRADGTFDSTQRISMRTGLFLSGDDNTNALLFKAPSGVDGTKPISWVAGTRNGQNKNDISIKVWGNAFNSVPGIRETVFEVYDSQGYYFYSQRQRPEGSETVGPIVTQFAGAVNANGSISTAGNLKVDGLSTLNGNVTMKNGLFLQGGSSITGQVKIGGTTNALRIWNAEYGAIFRRSESNLYIIPTNQNEGESGDIHSSLRPVRIGLNNGMVGLGRDSFIVDQNNALTTINSNSRINANFRMQLGQNAYIDIEASDGVRPTGCGSFASQNDVNVRAPIYMNIERTATSEYIPIVKQRYVKGDSTYSIGTLISQGDFRVHYHQGTSTNGVDLSWEFRRTGDFRAAGKIIAGAATLGTDGNITGGSLPNFANLNLTLDRKVNTRMVSYSGTGGWYKLATVTMPQSTSTVTFEIAGGNGYNVNTPHQCVTSKIVLRTSNNNPKGINAVVWSMDIGQGIKNVATVNTSGDVYDIYVNVGTYAQALAVSYYATPNATINQVFATDQPGATETPVELPETAIRGQVASVLNNLAPTPNGVKRYEADSEIAINSSTGIRIRSNGDKTGSVATMLRNDGGSFYILFTDKNATDGAATVNGDWNSKRPFAISLSTGEVLMNNGIAVRSAALFYNSINVKDNGSIYFDKSGANPRNMRIYHAGDASRGNRIEIADETNYIAYFEKTPGGANRFVVNNATVGGVNQMNSFGINVNNALGGNSITFGDNDTGIKQNGDGLLDIYANNVQVFRFQNGDLYSYKNINAPNVYIRSDIRLKSNFKPIENALDKVEKLNGVIYDKAEYIGGEAIETEAGIVAQTLQDVLPEAVRETEDSKGNKILTVSSQAQIALLVEAVKTLSSRVKELESKLM